MTTLREEKLDEQERQYWMESYLKSKGLLDMAKVAMMEMPSEASLGEIGISNSKYRRARIPEIHHLNIQNRESKSKKPTGVLSKMLKHNQEIKKKKLVKNIKRSERHQWKM